MNVSFFGYRPWALKIYENLKRDTNHKFTPISKSDVVLYYGWSKIIPEEIYKNKLCLILHPSPLPKYRGGSPLQHQIMAGEKTSAVTICKVEKEIDSGAIYSQTQFSLEGTLDDIFKRITTIGHLDTIKILEGIENGTIKPIKQDNSQATYFKRRTLEESEIKDIKKMSAEKLHNFIRALADPYPNAYIVCKDGKKVYFTGSHLEKGGE